METEQGANLVAISSSLMVSYDCEFSAKVIKALCDKSSMPKRLTPALSQWGALVNLCAPAVISSRFPILVEGFSPLLINNFDKKRGSDVEATSPSELAAALLELAQISTGKIAKLTLMGNGDCGWLAALAEWLFLLRVEIVDHTGTSLYQSRECSSTGMSSFHLTVIRMEDNPSEFPHPRLQTMLHSRIRLVTPGELVSRSTDIGHSFFQGRSEWSHILNDTFGSSFQKLLEPKIIPLFAHLLYSALYLDDREPAKRRVNPWSNTVIGDNDVQHRDTFMQMLGFAATRLPELEEVKKYVNEHGLELDESNVRHIQSRSHVYDSPQKGKSDYL